ncbi:MAG: SDR family oxidoreductase [Firmicutes bacterium]|nr:SDR family oxidoreductase [Bacillota bacterium]
MRVLILGKTGMLGHVVYETMKEKGYEVFGTSSKNGDLIYDAYTNMESIERIIEEIKPNAVVNCIGILNKVAEENKVLAVKLNSLLPHYLDELSSKYGFKFVHVSTDCVYEGTKGKYDELALPDATSFYGRSKALGEVKNDRSVTLRTSIVGPDNNPKGIGLFQWFINQTDTCGGYTKVIWTGVTTIELAKAICVAIEKDITGLNHVVNNEFIPKKDLLVLFKRHFDKDIEITDNDTVESQKTLIRTDLSYDFNVPSYDKMVEEMKEWVINHHDLYPNILENCNLER